MHVESTLVTRARRLELSPATFRKLALSSAAWLWLIVVTGATVRLTASGLGCEHWPGCTAGNPFPSKSYHSFIEFGNRIVSAVTILATLGGWVGARFTPGVPRWTAQARARHVPRHARAGAARRDHGLLGAEPVARHVALHARARRARGRRRARRRGGLVRARTIAELVCRSVIRRGALVAAAALLALVVTGTVSTAAGPHPGSADVERLWRLHAALYVHVRATAIFGALFLAFLVYIFRNRERWPLYAEGGGILLVVLLVQMGVGELQYRTHLPWWLVLVHVALAAAVWACAIALVAVIERPPKAFAPTLPRWPRS